MGKITSQRERTIFDKLPFRSVNVCVEGETVAFRSFDHAAYMLDNNYVISIYRSQSPSRTIKQIIYTMYVYDKFNIPILVVRSADKVITEEYFDEISKIEVDNRPEIDRVAELTEILETTNKFDYKPKW